MGGFTKTEETVGWRNKAVLKIRVQEKERKKKKKVRKRIGQERKGRNDRSFGVDEQPIRLPDELQLNHNPLNGDKHTPVSPVCLPQTPLNDCKH